MWHKELEKQKPEANWSTWIQKHLVILLFYKMMFNEMVTQEFT